MSPARPVYLDHNATAPTRPEAVAALTEALGQPNNPSSVHAFGRAARRALDRARACIARAVGAAPDDVVLTSGGTEANDLVLHGLDGPVVVSAIEHASVLEAVPEAPRAPVRPNGVIDLEALRELVERHRPRRVSVMLANNETGIIQPCRAAAEIAHAAGALLHVDAAQALGRVPLDLATLGADLLTLSAHKMGGPVGIGALALRPGIEIAARLRGGAQERGRRAGTENLPAALGWAAVLEAVAPDEAVRLGALRDRLEEAVLAARPDAIILGRDGPRLPNTSCLVTPGLDNATQLMALDLAGIAVSSGAACSSGKVGASHVLRAMGLSEPLARCAIRVSLGWSTTAADIERFLAVWIPLASGRAGAALASAPAVTT